MLPGIVLTKQQATDSVGACHFCVWFCTSMTTHDTPLPSTATELCIKALFCSPAAVVFMWQSDNSLDLQIKGFSVLSSTPNMRSFIFFLLLLIANSGWVF